jgi:hypothetical protein
MNKLALPFLLVALAPGHAMAQNWSLQDLAFSISAASSSINTFDFIGAGPIGPGSILTPPNAPPTPPPGFPYDFRLPLLGPISTPKYVGPLPDRLDSEEIDALSYIPWSTWTRVIFTSEYHWLFSVDQESLGTDKGQIPSESATNQHAADVWKATAPVLILGPTSPSVGCTLELDADGIVGSTPMLGVGLRDLSDRPDDLDALAFAWRVPKQLSFHSRLATSTTNGATIFWHNPQAFAAPGGGTFAAGTMTYATAAQLGLAIRDDVDALVVFENEFTGYQPAGGFVLPSGWADSGTGFYVQWSAPPPGGMPTSYIADRIFFSVARRSPIVGTPDSRFGIPINPGDILEPPAAGSPAGTPPRIVVLAEIIGLRADRIAPFDLSAMDDLDALELHTQ